MCLSRRGGIGLGEGRVEWEFSSLLDGHAAVLRPTYSLAFYTNLRPEHPCLITYRLHCASCEWNMFLTRSKWRSSLCRLNSIKCIYKRKGIQPSHILSTIICRRPLSYSIDSSILAQDSFKLHNDTSNAEIVSIIPDTRDSIKSIDSTRGTSDNPVIPVGGKSFNDMQIVLATWPTPSVRQTVNFLVHEISESPEYVNLAKQNFIDSGTRVAYFTWIVTWRSF